MVSVTLAITVGTLVGFLTAFRAIRYFTKDRKMSVPTRRDVKKDGTRIVWTVTTLAAPIVWFLAFIVGGNFGGAFASNLAEATGVSEVLLVPLGIGVGLAICIAFLAVGIGLLCIGALRILDATEEPSA